MSNWYFFPWTIQYLIGAVISLGITVPIFLSNSKIWAYRAFLGFGLCEFFYCLSAFFHRNAPDEALSTFFFRIDLFFASVLIMLIFLMIFFLWKEKKIFLLSSIPAIVVALYAIIEAPFTITWSHLGWSYKLIYPFNILFFIIPMGYTLLSLIALIYLMKKVPLKGLRKKYNIIILSIIICVPGSIITNIVLQLFPSFPPFGGIWIILQLIFIAKAISLKGEKIKVSLEDIFDKFLARLYVLMPGREFGGNVIEFSKYIEFAQLNTVVFISGDSYVFYKTRFSNINKIELLKKNIQYLENREYRSKISKEFIDLFSYIYKFSCTGSNRENVNIFNTIIQKHGNYLLESNALYNLGKTKFLKMLTEDSTLKDFQRTDKLLLFFKKLRLALNAYSMEFLGDGFRNIPDIKKNSKHNCLSLFMEYNLFFYDRFTNSEKAVEFQEGFISLTAQVVRLHNNFTIDLPVIPVFFYENLLNELYQLFSRIGGRNNIQELKRKESFFEYLKIVDDRIYFPVFDIIFLRNKLISMCKVFVKYFVEKFTEKTLKQFLYIMSKYAMPEAEIIIDTAKVYVIKDNNNLGFLLFNRFTKLNYPTIYIGKKVEGFTLYYKFAIIIEKKSLLDEISYENQISFNNPNKLLKTVRRFIKDNKNAVIMINGLDEMLYINSFNNVLEFIKNVRLIMEEINARLILLGNLLTLNEQEEQIIDQECGLLSKNNFFYNEG